MSIRTHILIIIGLAMAAIAAIVTFNAMQVRSNLMTERKLKTRHLVEAAYGVLEYWYAKQRSGLIDEATAKQEAATAIKALRYEGKEYFWLNDFSTPVPKMVMHPTVPALDGKVLDAEKFNCATSMQAGIDGPVINTNGKNNLFVAFNEVADRAGSGYVTYDWPKPVTGGGTTKELFPKMSFVKKFEGWNWVIGSGIYIDDIGDAVTARLLQDMAIAGGIAVLLLGFSLWQAGNIVRPLRATEAASRYAVSNNDFTRLVPISGNDEVGRVASAFNEMMSKLREIVQESYQSADAINNAAAGITIAAGEIVGNAERQATSASATAVAIEEISSSLSETAANALESEKAAQAAVKDAGLAAGVTQDNLSGIRKVTAAINNSTEEVRRLSESSTQINGIVGVIREIADQTNLLALNAAIEAARAGEQGRGFAVVADEVRKLAERTANSTREISGLIDQIQEHIQQAVGSMAEVNQHACTSEESAKQADVTLVSIVRDVESSGERAREIAHAVREQDASVQEIARQIEQIARMGDEATISARSNNDTADTLAKLAASLRNGVSKYRV